MILREITSKDEWEGFLEKCARKTFLQSWNWGEFNIATGNQKIWRFGVYSNNEILAVVFVAKVSAKRGTFLFVPHGPVLKEELLGKDKKEILQAIFTELKSIAKNEKADFIRVASLFDENQENYALFSEFGFRKAPMHASAYEATWKLDIFAPEDELLANMRKTTRYLIKKVSGNTDVSIHLSSDPADVAVYQELNKKVAQRQNFTPFSDSFIKNEFEIFAKDNQALFVFGRHQGKVVAGAMVIFWPASPVGGSGIAFYHQAGSLGEFAKLSIPYLLQWEAIREAKRRGCKVYDFWGFTDPEKFPKHPWAGPTLFKMGFGGYKEEYVKTQDFPLSKKYWINYIIETARKIKRGL